MESILFVFAVIIGLGAGLLFGLLLHKKQLVQTFDSAQKESKEILAEARKEADRITKDALNNAKSEARKRKQKFEDESRGKRNEILKLENKVKQREQSLEKKLDILDKKQNEIDEARSLIRRQEDRYNELIERYQKILQESQSKLEQIAKMSSEQAKRELVRSLEDEVKKQASSYYKELEEDYKKQADQKAQALISHAVQKLAGDFVGDATVSVVSIPSDEIKGRIIGREGRNIRTIESLTGVDVIIDDTPEAIIISSFNPVRREIAKLSIEKLIEDGRIHPARIEETIKRVEENFNQVILESGEQACFEVGITDLHPEISKALGTLKYRTLGHSTVLQHSLEVAEVAGAMAAEMGVDIKTAKRAGLLHDIGKAIGPEEEGPHAQIGAEFARKHGEADEVVEAIAHHHDQDTFNFTPLSLVVQAANSLSANRPGARKEQLISYLKRLKDMEDMVRNYEGVESVYVMQTGKEIRVMLKPDNVPEDRIPALAQDVAINIRKELNFPGQVNLTFIRESRFTEYAS